MGGHTIIRERFSRRKGLMGNFKESNPLPVKKGGFKPTPLKGPALSVICLNLQREIPGNDPWDSYGKDGTDKVLTIRFLQDVCPHTRRAHLLLIDPKGAVLIKGNTCK